MDFDNIEIIPEPEKGHYETIKEYTKEQPVYNDNGDVIGTETVVTGRDRKWVWTDEEEIKKQRRKDREPLLVAFDKWEKAVLRGREKDDYSVMLWYKDLLNLNDIAFNENLIPERIKYYL